MGLFDRVDKRTDEEKATAAQVKEAKRENNEQLKAIAIKDAEEKKEARAGSPWDFRAVRDRNIAG